MMTSRVEELAAEIVALPSSEQLTLWSRVSELKKIINRGNPHTPLRGRVNMFTVNRGDWLLCDFHIHTTMSDGVLPVETVVDMFGEKGFDVISITDHVLDSHTKKDPKAKGIPPERFQEYLKILWREAQRAWEKYTMLLMPGVELTNNLKKYHILVIDIKEYIDPTLPVEEIIKQVREQNAVAVACHPHHKANEGPQPFMHLWYNHKRYRDLFDAWEVANRDDLFNVIGLKRLNYLANSDFHEPRHLYSWKTLLQADKNPEGVKSAIRSNQRVAIYLFRDERGKSTEQERN